jgi:hypothetical protein
MSERASIFENSAEIDLSGFAPKPTKREPDITPEAVRAVAETAQFRSREPAPAPAPKREPPREEQRRYRTGRNKQLSLKVSNETADAFYAIADSQKWVLGETLERALAALQRELTAK